MNENSNRVVLAYSSPLLQDATVRDLGCSGEGQLRKTMMLHSSELETSDKRLKDLMKLFHNSPHMKKNPYAIVAQ